MSRRILEVPFSRFFSQSLWRPSIAAALLLSVIFPFHDMALPWPKFFALVGIGGIFYCAAAWALLDADDRWMAKKVMRGASKRRGLTPSFVERRALLSINSFLNARIFSRRPRLRPK